MSQAWVVPWYRRSDVNTAFSLAGILIPPLLWFVCFNLITGDVYYTRRARGDRIATWSSGNRLVAYAILGLQVLLLAYLWFSVAWVSATAKPGAEAIVSRYFGAMQSRELPPRDLYGSAFWRTVSPEQFPDLIGMLRHELGTPNAFELVGFEASSTGSVQLEYDVHYDRGHTRETFYLDESSPDEGMRILSHEIVFVD